MDHPDPQEHTEQPEQAEKANPKEGRGEATRAVTIILAEDLVKKLKIVALMRDMSISMLIETYVAKAVKADIKKAIGKLET